MAGAIGIKKIHQAEELWPYVEQLGDQQSYYLLERFVPGDIFHVDSIVYENQVLFAIASQYGAKVIAITPAGTPLAEQADLVLPLLVRENDYIFKPSTSRYAMLAMVGCGKFASVQEAADKLVEVASTTEPDAALTAKYEARYQNFKKLYPALKGFFAATV